MTAYPIKNRKRTDLAAFFGAFSIFLSLVEYMLPRPLPFLRYGLSNLPILLSLEFLDLPRFLLLITLKITGQGIFQGSFFSYAILLSAGGSYSGGMVMFILYRFFKKHLTFIGISVMGAFTSNCAQLILYVYLVFGMGGWIIAPVLFIIGLISSAAIGLAAEVFSGRSVFLEKLRQEKGL